MNSLIKCSILIIFLQITLIKHTFGQSNYVRAKFEIDDKEIRLNSLYEVDFVFMDSTGKTIFKPKIVMDSFILPKQEGSKCVLIFKYKSYILGYNFIYKGLCQNATWIFGFYSKKYYIQGQSKRFNGTDYTCDLLDYICFEPLNSDGICMSENICKREMLKKIRELLK